MTIRPIIGREDSAMEGTVKPPTPEGVGEMMMHYSEALDWINALEWWVRKQGLEVPTWGEMYVAGWRKADAVNLT